ncbi:MAG: ATP-binding protein [Candidatus ainarchaeum sp.]|nr:ATP-binding protein [Candidatus ainarchaeum sp.]
MLVQSSTAEVAIPASPLDRVIGQDDAVRIARIAAMQRRHLLLVGAPGTGKSMIAQAVASLLPRPTQEVAVLHNPENPERPFVEVSAPDRAHARQRRQKPLGTFVPVNSVPVRVAEELGFRCRRCATISASSDSVCPVCGADKYRSSSSPFDDLIYSAAGETRKERVRGQWRTAGGGEEIVVFERGEGGMVRVLTEAEFSEIGKDRRAAPRKVILPIDRNTFVQATGASETELLGDIRHDPYGGHPEAGTLPYLRVVPGAVHEAHQGVLFVDEISTLGYLQRFILTAMQEKKFPITGRNPSSSGASVRVDGVPCDFILVAALNTNDMSSLLPPLRNRIIGDGYEVLLAMTMPDNGENRMKLAQFIAQEIRKDGKIPHASGEAVEALVEEARVRAKAIDDAHNSLTLRLRGLSGLVKLAGDLASLEGAPLITAEHVRKAKKKAVTIEEQIGARFQSWWKAGESDFGNVKQRGNSSEVA